MTENTLLAIENLAINLPAGADRAFAVEGVTFNVNRNEIVCLVGESGSGKSMTAHAILRLLPDRTGIAQGNIKFDGQDIATAEEATMRKLRGGAISMIFQEPLSALNPL